MNNPFQLKLFTILFLVIISFACSNKREAVLMSPDGAYMFSLSINPETSEISYNVHFHDEEIIGYSKLGFEFLNDTKADEELKIKDVVTGNVNTSWTPVYGERNNYPDVYNEAFISFTGNNHMYALRIRAYNEGVAFRYEFRNEDKEIHISEERTEFNVPANASAWVSARAQSEIVRLKVSEIQEIKERPMLLQYSDSLFVAIGEAALVDYARMKLINTMAGSGLLLSQLEGEVKYDKPFNTPWRFVMAASQPGQLLENNFLLLNLNEPNQIKETSWIKPGKVIRETTLTTRGGMACVDFAVKHNLQYIEFDAGWYGSEYDDASDATTITVDPNRTKGPLDLIGVIKYAESKGIGVLLYVNRRALEKQLDNVLPLFRSWGVKGVKYGFVNVGTQEWTSWLHDAVRKAAEHELMIDVHDEYRPTGYSRTYPNFMTQEGIRGDEESPDNAMVLNTLFTRMIAGAGDHTNCYFAPRVRKTMGSHVSQLAKAVCIYSPWQFLFWYDRPEGSNPDEKGAGGSQYFIQEVPELQFFDRIPTVWDDTRVLEGYPGEFAVVARKSGDRWFLGAINGPADRTFDIKLGFLDQERKYKATVYSDDASINTPTHVRIEEIIVDASGSITREILNSNGLAVIFEKVD